MESDDEMSTNDNETSTSSDGSDNGASEREDIIDLCSDADALWTEMSSRKIVTMPEIFTMMPGFLELPKVDDIMQEPIMSVTGSEE